MKVLLCSPLSGKIGGISLWTKHIVNFFNLQYSDPKIILVDAGRKNDIYPNTPLRERISKGIQEYRVILKDVKNRLNEEKFDVLHLVSSASFSLLKDYFILKWAKERNVATAIHFHFGRIPQIFQKRNWEYKLLKKVISKADHIIVIDPISFQTLVKDGYRNVHFLPNPLSPDVLEVIKTNDISPQKNKIMFAGHVIPTKGIFELIEACENIDNIEVYILGAITDEMTSVIQEKTKNHADKFFVLGEKNHGTIIKEMLSSRIFALPSYTEGFPNVILESMAAGCAIISTNVGAIPEMLAVDSSHPCGVAIESKNSFQLKNAIEKFLADENFADKISQNAVKRVNQEYNIKAVSEKLIHIWKNTSNQNN